MKCRVFPENVDELFLDANAVDKDDYYGSNDDAFGEEFSDESFDD